MAPNAPFQTCRAAWLFPLVLALSVLSTTVNTAPQSGIAKPKTLEGPRAELKAFFLSEALAPLRDPDRVEVLPVEMVGGGLSSTSRAVERPTALDAATARQASKTLLAHDLYGGAVSACMFEPVMAIRFHKGSRSVQALVCFTCDELMFQENGIALGEKFGFRAARRPLLAVAKKAFPSDLRDPETPVASASGGLLAVVAPAECFST